MKDLRRIRRYLDQSTAIILANALVSSRLDYCNSLFHGLTSKSLGKLQVVQNTLCRIVTKTSKFSHITPIRKQLHWLPVHSRIIFKIGLLTYKALCLGSPFYLKEKLTYHSSSRFTRGTQQGTKKLLIPAKKAIHKAPSYLSKQFSFAAPSLWNSFPDHVRLAPSVSCFRSRLKSHLFKLAYSDCESNQAHPT